MNCPVCSKALSAMTVNQITLDICNNGCGGIWFDKHEFRKFDEKREPDVEGLLKINIQNKLGISSSDLHACPRCLNIKLMRHFASPKRKVTVDECPQCAGFWLDAGELTQIKNEYDSNEERTKAAEKVFADILESHPKENTPPQVETLRRVTNALKFITPSYYLKK